MNSITYLSLTLTNHVHWVSHVNSLEVRTNIEEYFPSKWRQNRKSCYFQAMHNKWMMQPYGAAVRNILIKNPLKQPNDRNPCRYPYPCTSPCPFITEAWKRYPVGASTYRPLQGVPRPPGNTVTFIASKTQHEILNLRIRNDSVIIA